MSHSHELTPEMRECIQNCLDCHAICMETIAHCLTMGGKHAEVKHQRLLADCAQACQTSADFMLRSSHSHAQYCAICADICDQCADACSNLGPDDAVMRKCADQCRKCSQSCHSMSGATV